MPRSTTSPTESAACTTASGAKPIATACTGHESPASAEPASQRRRTSSLRSSEARSASEDGASRASRAWSAAPTPNRDEPAIAMPMPMRVSTP